MSTVPNIWRLLLPVRNVVRKNTSTCLGRSLRRNYADSSNVEPTSKQVVAQGTENDERVRVRRARVSDVPRVLRFVRENVRVAWPALVSPTGTSHVVLADYVTRALAQGHSIIAEQVETRRGWSQLRGLALGTALCPWDAAVLERWARCVKCARSRKLMNFTAHCLRAPSLHDKYRVHNILQVILIVPPDNPKSAEIVSVLAKNAIQRGRECGFPLIRFDVSNDLVSNSLEQMQLKKEWQLAYHILPHTLKEKETPSTEEKGEQEPISATDNKHRFINGNYIAVYTAFSENKDVQKS